MERNFYGKKWLIADLTVVSIWALFMWHTSWGSLMAPILTGCRVALSFMIYRHSGWSLWNAVMYGIMFFSYAWISPDYAATYMPIKKIVYVAGCLMGNAISVYHSFNPELIPEAEGICEVVWWIFASWLALLPMIWAWPLRRLSIGLLKRRKMIWYNAGIAVLCIISWILGDESVICAAAFLLFMDPVLSRCFYPDPTHSLLGEIVSDRALLSYLLIAGLFLCAHMIGIRQMGSLGRGAAFLFPVILYVVAMKLSHVAIRTFPAFLYGFGVWCCVNLLEKSQKEILIMVGFGLCAIIAACVLIGKKDNNWFTATMLLLTGGFLFPWLLNGYNIYAAPGTEYVCPISYGRRGAPYGLYEISREGYLGLRDRYRVLLGPEWGNFYFLEDEDYYIVLRDKKDSPEGRRLQIYDLKTHNMILPEGGEPVVKISRTGNHTYDLLGIDDEKIYELQVRGWIGGLRNREPRLIKMK